MKCLFLICLFFLTVSRSAGKTPPPPPPTPVDYQQLLHDLSGHWKGSGYTVIAIPSETDSVHDFELKFMHTDEEIVFSSVREQIRNAGDKEETFFSCITYLHQVTDRQTHAELHVEPGMWAHQPADTLKLQPEELFRAASVPHGLSFLAGTVAAETKDEKKPPVFEDISALPFPFGEEDNRLSDPYTDLYDQNPKIPDSMIPKYTSTKGVNVAVSPAAFLKKDNEGQIICQTKTIAISSVAAGPNFGGVLNIPGLETIDFVNVSQVEAKFYIEKVKGADNSLFWQLQYVQEVYINFPVPVFGVDQLITWPHISVATLRKVAGEYL